MVDPCPPLLQRVIIYPNYLNIKKTVAEGRRIPKDKGQLFIHSASSISVSDIKIWWSAACDNPQLIEMLDSCTKGLKLAAELEVRHAVCTHYQNINIPCSVYWYVKCRTRPTVGTG